MTPLPPTRERPTVLFPPAHGQPGSPHAAVSGGPPPKRWHRWLRITAFTIAIVFAVAIGAFASTAFFAKHEVDTLFTHQSQAIRNTVTKLTQPLPDKPANVLILGSDHRSGDAAGDSRSDTILLMRLDPKGNTISMLSFPRDLYVPIPGHGSSKINDAYSYGGPALTIETIKQLTGLDVNFIVNIDFAGFRGIVDTLGGVYVDVDRRYQHVSNGDYSSINLQPGYQLLDGRQALSYARYRHTDSDFYRIARQQLVMTQIKKQIGASSVLKNIPGLFQVLNKNTDMAVGGKSGKVDTQLIINYLRLALSLKAHSVFQYEVQGGIGVAPNGGSIVEANASSIQAQVNAFLHPDSRAQSKTADQVTGEKAVVPATTPAAGGTPAAPVLPAPANVTIKVVNGNGIGGSAGTTAAGLRTLGYPTTVEPGLAGSADNLNYANTHVVYRASRDAALAESVAKLFTGATTEKSTGTIPFTQRLLVIVGKTGSTPVGGTPAGGSTMTTPAVSSATAENNKVPVKQAATVVADTYSAPMFQTLRGKVKMPVLYPSMRETSSTYDDGVYVYKIPKGRNHYDAYRMVAKSGGGAGDYWGFQATTWATPPVLDDPTRTLVRGNRTYRLYFNGTKLHIVAWTQGSGTYWITNTLLDKLSNETMLAIAEGVKSLPHG